MKSNIGVLDKIVRLSIILIIGALYLVGALDGLAAIIFAGIGIYLALTSFVGFCPIYRVFSFTTVESKKTKRNSRR